MYTNKERELLSSEYKEIKKIAKEIRTITETQNKLINSLYEIIKKLKHLLFIALIIIIIFVLVLLYQSTLFTTKTEAIVNSNNNTILNNNNLDNHSTIKVDSKDK